MRATAIAALLTCSVFASGCAHVFSDEPIEDTQTITLAEPAEVQRPVSHQTDSRLTWGSTSVVPAGVRDPYPLAMRMILTYWIPETSYAFNSVRL